MCILYLYVCLALLKWLFFLACPNVCHTVACEGSVVLTQTRPAAPYVCRTGNITLRCQFGGVENVLIVLWSIGNEATSNVSTIPGHTAFPHTITYQEVVVDSYTNLAAGYRCRPTLSNGSLLQSNPYNPQYECEFLPNLLNFCCAHRSTCLYIGGKSSNVLLYSIIIVCCGDGVDVLHTGYYIVQVCTVYHLFVWCWEPIPLHWPAFLYYVCLHFMYIQFLLSCWSDPPQPDLGK